MLPAGPTISARMPAMLRFSTLVLPTDSSRSPTKICMHMLMRFIQRDKVGWDKMHQCGCMQEAPTQPVYRSINK